MSEAPVGYALEQLEPSEPPPRDAAERELRRARAEAQELREQARAEGFEQGRAAGHTQGRSELESALAALREAREGLLAIRDEVADAVERDAVELALALAGKVLLASLQVRPELVVEVVQGALRRVSGQRSISIVVNPVDLEIVRAALGDLREQSAAVEQWDLQPDQRVQAGGAIVRTEEGEVDAQVLTQLERAHEVVAGELGPRRDSAATGPGLDSAVTGLGLDAGRGDATDPAPDAGSGDAADPAPDAGSGDAPDRAPDAGSGDA